MARSVPRSRSGFIVLLPLAVLLVCFPSLARAAEPPNGPDWAFGHPAGEAVVAALSAGSMALAALPQRATDWSPSPVRPRDETYGMVSDFTGSGIGSAWQILGGWALDVGYYEQHDADDPYGRALRTALVDTEALMLSTGITFAIKRLTGRCRPRAWLSRPDGTGTCDPSAPEHDGFPSGHVSAVGAVAGSRLVLALRSTGSSERRTTAFAMAETATVATAVLRVLAGAHSWEDVLAGWALGHGAGVLVSLLHPMADTPIEAPGAAPGSALGAAAGRWPQAQLTWAGSF